MRHPITTLFLALAVLVTAGCGFHLRGTTQIPEGLSTLVLSSSDPYGPLAREVRQQLLLNDVTLLADKEENKSTPTLRIIRSSLSKDTASIFQDGRTAEYQMVMTVNAQVLIPGKDIYPIQVKAYRSFFDNPLTALAKDAEQDLIIQEMYSNVAQQLIRKLLAVQNAADEDQPVALEDEGTSSSPSGRVSTSLSASSGS